MNDALYLDYAAATPVDDTVLAAMQPFYQRQFFNPSATYLAAQQTATALETARSQVAHWLGARPSEIIFTAGGTEANNLAIQGIMQRYPQANCIVSAIEHESVLEPARRYSLHQAPVKVDGRVDLEALATLIDDRTVLLSIMYANNEIGTIQPIREISQLLKEVRHQRRLKDNDLPIYLHTDACQAAQYLDLQTARLGVDLLTINGGKIYGPKQSGALYVKAGVELEPLLLGGGQERGLRSGTENVAQAVGLATALELVQSSRHQEAQRMQEIQKVCIDQLTSAIPDLFINGSLRFRLPNNVHITLPGTDNERILIELDEQGIMAAAGSACSASNEQPSHVLRALGLSDTDAQSSLRFTMGRQTTEHDLTRLVKTLQSLL